ncbi:GDSL esterase/lipase CPRD49-like isoform X2 [Zingiber officinale]|uniref:GDSL esterase/lipase CPRD49-like isoform X2 n=1 Tax=Zingiber officinale TaxID=94328 RepID=UPI001C4C8721|nr:GDSL esterase/lipase CPRD49-like isoform X2 [Zingiber officinale]
MVGPARPVFVLFGSSIVQFSFSNGGWGAILADVYARKADIILRGYLGWNSRRGVQVLEEVFPKDAAVQPSLVIVYFGGNDSMGSHSSGLGPHVPLPEYIENMRKIGTHLKSLSGKTRVIFLSNPPVNEEMIRCAQSDGIHLSSEGSKILVAEIIKILKEADWKPSLYWKSMPTEFSEDSPFDLVASNGVSTINISNLTTHREIEWD